MKTGSIARSLLPTVLLLPLLLLVPAAGGATPLDVALDIQGQGLALASGGVGLQGIGAGTRNLTVTIGGPVQAALLYWAGRDRPCPRSGGNCIIPFQPYKDQVLRFDGAEVTGTVIGSEGQPVSGGGPINNIGYLADVTAIVQARGTGAQTFAIQDADLGSNLFRLNGAGLLVVYTDPGDATDYRLIVVDGLDFAYGDDPTPGPTRVTQPVALAHGAAAVARMATLRIFAGDAVAGRPDRIDISANPSLVNTLNSSAGNSWDADVIAVSVPAGAASTTVQLVSEPVGSNPDSLLWEVGALRLPLPGDDPIGDEGCTPGYWKNHPTSWAGTGYVPGQAAGGVFALGGFPSLASQTLLQALQGGGGSGTLGGARILLRAAVAALLNAASPGVEYPRTAADVIDDVNAALASNDRATMLALAGELDADNNLGCPLI